MPTLMHHFEEGGWGMYPLAACFVLVLALSLDRAIALHRRRPDPERFLAALQHKLCIGDVAGVLGVCSANPSPIARVAAAALREALQSRERILAAALAQQARERVPIEQRTGALATLAGLATLIGLLGTTTGIHAGFSLMVSRGDAVSFATMLARSVSESLNCTAGGLFVSITAIVPLARERMLIDELQRVARSTSNLLIIYRPSLRLGDRRPPLELPTYRTAA